MARIKCEGNGDRCDQCGTFTGNILAFWLTVAKATMYLCNACDNKLAKAGR